MTELTFREKLPDDVNELKDIIELQLAKIKELDKKFKMYNDSPFTKVDFINRNPPNDWEDEF